MKILPVRIAPSLALLLGLFSLFPAPASAAAAQPWQWNLPTGTAVAINSSQATTGTLLALGNTAPTTRGAASNAPAAAAAANAPSSASIAPLFEYLRIIPGANAPAQCNAAIYGSLAARAPDGALCLCHQSYDGKQGFWEQLGTGKACWPDNR
jgi:hypothetical protein